MFFLLRLAASVFAMLYFLKVMHERTDNSGGVHHLNR